MSKKKNPIMEMDDTPMPQVGDVVESVETIWSNGWTDCYPGEKARQYGSVIIRFKSGAICARSISRWFDHIVNDTKKCRTFSPEWMKIFDVIDR